MKKIGHIDDLVQFDKKSIKRLLRNVELCKIAIALHGLSPELRNKIKRSLPVISRIRLLLSSITYTSIRLPIVEEVHEEILAKMNLNL